MKGRERELKGPGKELKEKEGNTRKCEEMN